MKFVNTLVVHQSAVDKCNTGLVRTLSSTGLIEMPGTRTPGCNLVRRLRVVLALSSHVCLCTYYNSHVPCALAKRGFHGGPLLKEPASLNRSCH